MVSGFINLMKEKGMTSSEAVNKVKYILKDLGIKTKIGHFGTLDPDGEGVLPIALGYATRLFDYDLEKRKVYYTEFRFGLETNTLDESGNITLNCENIPTKEDINRVIDEFKGDLEQIPPQVSAKLVNGQRAYKLERQGIEFTLNPRKISIYSFELIEQLSKDTFSFLIECSSGTYVRSLARDLAYRLNTLAIMRYIRREQNSIFNIQNSKTLDQLKQNINSFIIPIEIFTDKFQRYDIDSSYIDKLLNGVILYFEDMPEGFFTVYCSNELYGIGERGLENRLIIKTRLI